MHFEKSDCGGSGQYSSHAALSTSVSDGAVEASLPAYSLVTFVITLEEMSKCREIRVSGDIFAISSRAVALPV